MTLPLSNTPHLAVVSPAKPKALQLGHLLDKTFGAEHVIVGGGLLNKGSLLIIGGPPKTYKSFVVNSIAYHLATATPVFNVYRSPHAGEIEYVFPVPQPQRVLILEQEIGERDLQLRFNVLLNKIPQAERILCREKIFTYSCDANMRLDTPGGRKIIEDLITDVSPDVVCFDPFIEFHSIEENSSKEMSSVLHELDKLRQRLQFTTVMTHHSGKMKEFSRGGAEKLRGSSVLHGKGDSFMMLESFGQESSGGIQVHYQFRRGEPVPDMNLAVDFSSLLVRFDYWKNTPKGRRPGT